MSEERETYGPRDVTVGDCVLTLNNEVILVIDHCRSDFRIACDDENYIYAERVFIYSSKAGLSTWILDELAPWVLKCRIS